ncbi:metallophosphoesterase [soil metagenome]
MALGGAAAVSALYATFVEPRWLRRTETRMHFHALPAALEGLRLAVLTDIHARGSTPAGLIRRAVRLANEARPDLIAITGDIAETEAALEGALGDLSELRAPLGVFVVPGNHDYHDIGIERWHDAIARNPRLTDLTNRTRIVNVRGRRRESDVARLCIAGVDDRSHGTPRMSILADSGQRDFTILLAHHPEQAEHARRATDDVDLVLSGHTHGGQVRLPGLGAIVNSTAHPDLYDAGVRRRPWTQVYTSRGIGTTHLPIRFLTRPEVAIVTLTAATRPQRSPMRPRRQCPASSSGSHA